VSLVAAELERHGLATVAIRFRRSEAESLPPRALRAQFRHGFPDDPVGAPGRLLGMVEAAVDLLEEAETGPALVSYHEADAGRRADS
jgi:hypothetical protein